jgi:hypothetical protein
MQRKRLAWDTLLLTLIGFSPRPGSSQAPSHHNITLNTCMQLPERSTTEPLARCAPAMYARAFAPRCPLQ